jgi:hypothetical protein
LVEEERKNLHSSSFELNLGQKNNNSEKMRVVVLLTKHPVFEQSCNRLCQF